MNVDADAKENPDADPMEPSGTDPGNTKNRGPYVRYWFLTDNTYPYNPMEPLEPMEPSYLKALRFECEWYVCQVERGEETGHYHIQGQFCFKNRMRLTTLKQLGGKGLHWETTISVKSAIAYCSKEATRCGPQWIHGIKLPPKIRVEEPYGWQLEVIDIIKSEPHPRTIHWFWETKGGFGKSSLCKYMVVKHDALILSGKSNDMFHALSKYIERTGHGPNLVIIDIPRSQQDFINYGAIEMIKNGLVFSGKYESHQLVYNAPHVVCFANEPPNDSKMSRDRWHIVSLRGETRPRLL